MGKKTEKKSSSALKEKDSSSIPKGKDCCYHDKKAGYWKDCIYATLETEDESPYCMFYEKFMDYEVGKHDTAIPIRLPECIEKYGK